ncbi:conserved hypothetical protein [gamma proteobacterium HdN1]|nr:conserved hypothetical protein [gamma proteobacterium HdN1]
MRVRPLCIFLLLALPLPSWANSSTGSVNTGGVQYLKSKSIQMYSEDLYISKKVIKVDYQFKNLTSGEITETILFPLPRVPNYSLMDFPYTPNLIKSFKIYANGERIIPKVHVRAFKESQGDGAPAMDITDALKSCGFSDKDLQGPWIDVDTRKINKQTLRDCKNPIAQQLINESTDPEEVLWESQIIYRWDQTFKANSLTRIQHEYQPLLGGDIGVPDEDWHRRRYCTDRSFIAAVKKTRNEQLQIENLGYILKTGANWAKPIQNFTLTIERDPNELISLCWDGKIKKINPTQFQAVETNFVPTQDVEILFVHE